MTVSPGVGVVVPGSARIALLVALWGAAFGCGDRAAGNPAANEAGAPDAAVDTITGTGGRESAGTGGSAGASSASGGGGGGGGGNAGNAAGSGGASGGGGATSSSGGIGVGTGGRAAGGSGGSNTGGSADGGVDLAPPDAVADLSGGDSRDVPGDGSPDATGAADRNPAPTRPKLTPASKLDLLFLIDDSSSMAPLQAKLRSARPNFINALREAAGGLPDLHLAVASSSLGAGRFDNVPGCAPGTKGNLNGDFQHAATCTQLHPGQSFISSTAGPGGTRLNNFDGDVAEVFDCIANIGDMGCGFEHQFAAMRTALEGARSPGHVNANFLRDDAQLAVIVFSNEDDCSAPPESALFDPNQTSVSEGLGGLQSYRCNEFGHVCNGGAPPHQPPGADLTLTECRSNENGPLLPVSGFIDYLFRLKPQHPEMIFAGAIAGPAGPYVVTSRTFSLPTGTGQEQQPSLMHSCISGAFGTEYADPGVRLRQWTDGFAPNSFFGAICADDLTPTVVSLARALVGL